MSHSFKGTMSTVFYYILILCIFSIILCIMLVLSMYDRLMDKMFLFTKRLDFKSDKEYYEIKGNPRKYILYFPGLTNTDQGNFSSVLNISESSNFTVLGFRYTNDKYVDDIVNLIIRHVPRNVDVMAIGFSYGGAVSIRVFTKLQSIGFRFKSVHLILYKTFDNTLDAIRYQRGLMRAIAFLFDMATSSRYSYDNTTNLLYMDIDYVSVIVNKNDDLVPFESMPSKYFCDKHSINYFEETKCPNMKASIFSRSKYFSYHMFQDTVLLKHVLTTAPLIKFTPNLID